MNWTLTKLITALSEYDPRLTLSFETKAGAAGPGFHVTEFKVSDVQSIDCGGTLNRWSEAGLQLMDGYANDPMSLGKFGSIANKSVTSVPGLADHEIYVEFSPKNAGLTRHKISKLTAKDGKVIVELGEDQAICKPMKRATLGCCGGAPAEISSCC